MRLVHKFIFTADSPSTINGTHKLSDCVECSPFNRRYNSKAVPPLIIQAKNTN